jgi:hypothetical protein
MTQKRYRQKVFLSKRDITKRVVTNNQQFADDISVIKIHNDSEV